MAFSTTVVVTLPPGLNHCDHRCGRVAMNVLISFCVMLCGFQTSFVCSLFLQIRRTPYSLSQVVKFLKQTYYNEGVLGLWRGNSATMARIIPHGAIQFTAHEQWMEVLGLNVISTTDK